MSGMGITKAPFLNFSANKIFDHAKYVRFFESHFCLTTVKYLRDISIANVYFDNAENFGK